MILSRIIMIPRASLKAAPARLMCIDAVSPTSCKPAALLEDVWIMIVNGATRASMDHGVTTPRRQWPACRNKCRGSVSVVRVRLVGFACERGEVLAQGVRKTAADAGNWALLDRVTLRVVLRTGRGGSGLVPLGSASAAAVAHGLSLKAMAGDDATDDDVDGDEVYHPMATMKSMGACNPAHC